MRASLCLALLPTLAVFASGDAHAILWCARPLYAHEWGVHVYGGDGAPLPAPAPLPSWFHTPREPAPPAAPPAVRSLPVDSGIRDLPVLHLYGEPAAAIPLAIDVGFSAGPASAWFPQVDALRSAAEANSAAAAAARASLLSARSDRLARRSTAPVPADPTRQLGWDRLDLTATPNAPPHADDAPWIAAARALDALWVNRGAESERFVFYEAQTAEPLPLALRRDRGWTATHRAYVLENRGGHPLHDVFVTHAERGKTYVFAVKAVAAGGQVRFVIEDHVVADRRAATWDRLRAALVDPAQPEPPKGPQTTATPCVTDRDPAYPFERVDGHGLYRGEVELLLSVWGARLFDQPGTTVVWREDAAALTAAMPLAIFTDMYHHVLIHRAGLALWERVELP
ncbi:MAG: hypothetical protein CVU56_00525 [Deltaproteobacteria bacterium HGW-Deltaproteobacteria-14]|jgi:hypothetical protein|nr:MAG: hypothetical protein CVU56_00525 [Deltaproteobacteria bacterium HGW-Deltaproteobacteria-14]